jgi:hypothetical protein
MKRTVKRGLPVVVAALAVAAAGAMAVPASAATDYRATLVFTLGRGNSVLLGINNSQTCYTGFTADVPKEVPVTVSPGQYIRIASLQDCYAGIAFRDVTITSDGQRAEFTL